MDKRKALPKGLRCFLLLLQHFLVVMVAFFSVIIISNVVVIDEQETQTKGYCFNLFESEKEFKDTEVFFDLFYSNLGDLIQEVVISSQIGEDGSFDANHIVNISDYANRKNSGYIGKSDSPEYRLSDLLKWYNCGFSYEALSFQSLAEFEEYFDITIASTDRLSLAGIENVFSDLVKAPCSIWSDGEEIHIEISVLKEMFLPTDGISLAERATTIEEYGVLIDELHRSINDLGINVQTYHSKKDSFDSANSNLRYYFVLSNEDGREKIYSNLKEFDADTESYFKSLDAYVVYNPGSLDFETNIHNFRPTHLKNELDVYSYVFENAVSVYIGVDGAYGVSDVFAKAYTSYRTINNVWFYIGLALLAALLWLFLLVFLSVMAGRKKTAGNIIIEETWVDLIPTEIHLTLFGGLLFLIVYGSALLLEETRFTFWVEEGSYLRIGAIVVSFLISMFFSVIWYGMIRRIKLHILFKNSICGIIVLTIWKWCKGFCRFIKRNILYCYNHLGTMARVLIPLSLIFMCNLILGCIISAAFQGNEIGIGLFLLMMVFAIDILFAYFVLRANVFRKKIIEGIHRISDGELDYQLSTEGMQGENLTLATAVNNIGSGIKKAVETSMRDEKMKADLITNVSHDIKTPLTSIINYVDLLKREHIETEPIKGYIEVLDAKSQRLKQLTDDLVEASKISSGNIVFDMKKIVFAELLKQSIGEFSEKFENKNMTLVENYPDDAFYINVDPARIWRVIENLFNNILKYGLEGTRVYLDLERKELSGQKAIMVSIKNISKNPLNISPEELTERFIRGDESRTTEGSGLGLSIAKSLTEAMGGKFEIILDGDLFKVLLYFPEVE